MSADAGQIDPTPPRVVLGVCGGIACYKVCTVARDLTDRGIAVDVVLTQSALEFIRPPTFEALTGRRVLSSLWEPGAALDHIRWTREADLVIVAPATAHILARAAQGLADDFLSTLLVASTGPVLVAPAMNDDMWENSTTQKNVETLKQRGWSFLGPAVGPLAEGPSSRPGRMVEADQIVAEAIRMIRRPNSPWLEKRVLVTAGATLEEIDPVRVLTNRSSGKMGFAIAQAAYERGADVVLISGPTPLPTPWGVERVAVSTTDEMLAAVAQQLPGADVVVMAAAPADYRPTLRSEEKLTRNGGSVSMTLEPTRDILAETADARKSDAVIVGFALETGDGRDRARHKLRQKHLDMIALNVVCDGNTPFESDENQVVLITSDREQEVPRLPKLDVGHRLLDAVETLF